MHYLLVGGITILVIKDEISMVSVLVCMDTLWTRLIMNHDIRLSIVMIHQASLIHV